MDESKESDDYSVNLEGVGTRIVEGGDFTFDEARYKKLR
jgi:hypothetical protein